MCCLAPRVRLRFLDWPHLLLQGFAAGGHLCSAWHASGFLAAPDLVTVLVSGVQFGMPTSCLSKHNFSTGPPLLLLLLVLLQESCRQHSEWPAKGFLVGTPVLELLVSSIQEANWLQHTDLILRG